MPSAHHHSHPTVVARVRNINPTPALEEADPESLPVSRHRRWSPVPGDW